MVQADPYQFLQIIGLSLPFLALYLTVLVEIHKLPKPIQVASSEVNEIDGKVLGLAHRTGDDEWAGSVTLSYAYQQWDFVFALVSIVLILLSAIGMILSMVVNTGYLREAAFGLLIISYAAVALSVVFTLWFCYSHFSPSDD